MTNPSRAIRIAGSERLRERDRAVAVEGVGPAGDGSRDADGEPAVAGGRERQRRAVLPERVDPHVGRCRLAVVDRGDGAACRPEQHEAAAADAAPRTAR